MPALDGVVMKLLNSLNSVILLSCVRQQREAALTLNNGPTNKQGLERIYLINTSPFNKTHTHNHWKTFHAAISNIVPLTYNISFLLLLHFHI